MCYGQGVQRLGTGWSSGGSREGPVSGLCSEPQPGTHHLGVSISLRHVLKDAGEPKVTVCHGSQLKGRTIGFYAVPIKNRSSNGQCLACLRSQADHGPRGTADPPKAGPHRPLGKGKKAIRLGDLSDFPKVIRFLFRFWKHSSL